MNIHTCTLKIYFILIRSFKRKCKYYSSLLIVISGDLFFYFLNSQMAFPSRNVPESIAEKLEAIELHELEDELYSEEEEEEEEGEGRHLSVAQPARPPHPPHPPQHAVKVNAVASRLASIRQTASQSMQGVHFEPPPGLTPSQRFAALRRFSEKITLRMEAEQDINKIETRCKRIADAFLGALLNKDLQVEEAIRASLLNFDSKTGKGVDWGPICSIFHANDFEDASGRIAFIDFQFRQALTRMASGDEDLDLTFVLEFLKASVAGSTPVSPLVGTKIREMPKDAAALGPWHSLSQLAMFGVYFFKLAFGIAKPLHHPVALALFRSFVRYAKRLIAWRFTPIRKLSCDTSPFLRSDGSHWVRLAIEEALHLRIHDDALEHVYGEKYSRENAAIQKVCLELYALDDSKVIQRLANSKDDEKVLAAYASSEYSKVQIPLELKSLWTTSKTPCAKVRAVARASKMISGVVVEAGADELLPCFLYTMVQAVGSISERERAPNIASQCAFIEDAIASEEDLMLSEAGYALALLQTATEAINKMLPR